MNTKHVITAGEYLGYCTIKGYLYSIFKGYEKNGKKRYSVVAMRAGNTITLIDFEGDV